MWNKIDYGVMSSIVFKTDYPGLKPTVVESPHGDGKLDTGKCYAHIALKYLKEYKNVANVRVLMAYLNEANKLAYTCAKELGIPHEYLPNIEDSTIRILSYPPQAISNEHTDFDLFTLMMYRNQPECFNYCRNAPAREFQAGYPQIHYGELLALVADYPATYHEVLSSEIPQESIVFFAMPSLTAILPDGQTVRTWLKERKDRSRY